jgi:hypothetical protein
MSQVSIGHPSVCTAPPQVETVLIPVVREGGTKARVTLCVSSQVGCAMNCQFCFTGEVEGGQAGMCVCVLPPACAAAPRAQMHNV